ncbi:MAG: molybdenum cofactor biosynthesis protein MoaE [Pseudomonadota bacterium]
MLAETSESTAVKISVQTEDFDIGIETDRIRSVASDIGGIASFVGVCRSEDGTLSALELEHYPGMAEGQIATIVNQAFERWDLKAATVIHRYGIIPVGENIVLIITASTHRKAALEAADFLMDYLKTKAPFWKKERFVDGSTGEWVAAATRDDEAAARWDSGP